MNAPARPNFQSIPLGTKKKDIDQLASQATSYAVKNNIPVQVHPRPVQAAQGQTTVTDVVVEKVTAPPRAVERFTGESGQGKGGQERGGSHENRIGGGFHA
jgi:hypothetical protein